LPFFKAGKELKDLINSKLRRTQEMPVIEITDSSPSEENRSQSVASSRGR